MERISQFDNERFRSCYRFFVKRCWNCGDTIPQKKIVEKVLRSLPQKFKHIVAVIEETNDLSQLSFYELMGSLEAQEKRISMYASRPLEQAFRTEANISNKQSKGVEEHKAQDKGTYGRGKSQFRGRGAGKSIGRGEATRCKAPNQSNQDGWFKDREVCRK